MNQTKIYDDRYKYSLQGLQGLTDVLHSGFEAIRTNDFSMPLKFYPNEMHHNNPKNCWDAYENEKFVDHWQDSVNRWNKIVGLARRIEKLERKREQLPFYCNKSYLNLTKKIINLTH